MTDLQDWLEYATEDPDLIAELQALVDANDTEALNDRFYRELEFGTGGLRGEIGAGTNRMNIYTVRKATQGFADYINASGVPASVAIAYDSRIKGELFAREAACVLAANGILALLYPRLQPTPALSFAVRHLGCGGGICVTASHNPAAYNGYKVYGADGCQITTEAAAQILEEINQIDPFEGVEAMDFDEALEEGSIAYIGEDTLDAFLEAVAAQSSGVQSRDLALVYTPLNGTGLECVTRTLAAAGFANVTVVESQREPDGNFPTCPYPNPEIREALAEGLALCETAKPDLLLATDPDADRVGIAVRHDGEYRLLTGNEVGVLLLDFILRTRGANGTLPASPVAVKTIVTTDMAAAICEKHGVELRETLTGFKFIGEQIGLLEASGEEGRYIFGFEESYGYLPGGYVRDKDAVAASLLICEMAADAKAQGKTLVDTINDLYNEYGWYKNGLLSFTFKGESGMKAMQGMMQRLRQSPPATIGGLAVEAVTDYAPGIHGLPPSDVLSFGLAGGAKLLVRPSGTEPKIKLYLMAKGNSEAEANTTLAALEAWANSIMAG